MKQNKRTTLILFLVTSLALTRTVLMATVSTNGDVGGCFLPAYYRVGYQYPNASLQVDGGSFFTVPNEIHAGVEQTSSNNVILVKDAGTLVSVPGRIYVGGTSSGNSFSLRSGAHVHSSVFSIGSGGDVAGCCCFGFSIGGTSSSNSVVITDGGTVLTITYDFDVGAGGLGNSLIISNGAHVASESGGISGGSTRVVLTGSGSRWDTSGDMRWSGSGAIGDGAQMTCQSLSVAGNGSVLTVADPGSSLIAPAGIGLSGYPDPGCSLVISNGAQVASSGQASLGDGSGPYSHLTVTGSDSRLICSNLLIYGGSSALVSGSVFVTNSGFSGTLAISGSLTNTGLIVADQIVCNNGFISFPVNTIMAKSAGITNGRAFVVGDGTGAANYVMQGGTHSFNNGLVISNSSILSGCGTVTGSVTNYGTIVPGNGCSMDFLGPVVNYGTILSLNGTPIFHSTFVNNGTLHTSTPRVTGLSVSGADVVVHFNTVSNYLHDVQARSDLASSPWSSLTNGLVGTGGPMTVTDPGGATNLQRFYRVLLHY